MFRLNIHYYDVKLVSVAAVSKWETGNSIPDILMLCSIADFFDVSTDELLGRTKNKKRL